MSTPITDGLVLTPSDSAKTLIQDGWFFESEAMWPGQKMGIQVEEVLVNGKSQFQDILLFKSVTYGIVLVLDGVIQVTERDEHSYQEMITHLPMFAHKFPKKVLIVGGGDGGVLREVCKHPSVETIHMCEIDQQVCEISKKYYPDNMAVAFNDPRLTLMYDDAARYLKNEGATQEYDVIICDSSDPVGPADVLFQPEFFQSMHNALNPTGVLCTQGECLWLHLDLIAGVVKNTRKMFPTVKYAYTTIPTYPSGQIGFVIASNDKDCVINEPTRPAMEGLKYYSTELHKCAFVLPKFAEEKINKK